MLAKQASAANVGNLYNEFGLPRRKSCVALLTLRSDSLENSAKSNGLRDLTFLGYLQDSFFEAKAQPETHSRFLPDPSDGHRRRFEGR